LRPVETPPSNIVAVFAFDMASAITVNRALPVSMTVMASEPSAELATEYHSSKYIGLPVPMTRRWKVKWGEATLRTAALPPAVFIPTRTITTSWLLLVVRLTASALAELALLCAFPSRVMTFDPELVMVLVLTVELVVDVDCFIASTKTMPFSPTLVEKEYRWGVCGVVTTL
jgi:hypothetical protein